MNHPHGSCKLRVDALLFRGTQGDNPLVILPDEVHKFETAGNSEEKIQKSSSSASISSL